ncbi:MAG: hypothetical protein M1358_02465 [Chloroflexi bacterium]|nr:hypothetical protein [Chloroflexota bacterium]
MMILFWGGIVALIVWVVRAASPRANNARVPESTALEILQILLGLALLMLFAPGGAGLTRAQESLFVCNGALKLLDPSPWPVILGLGRLLHGPLPSDDTQTS